MLCNILHPFGKQNKRMNMQSGECVIIHRSTDLPRQVYHAMRIIHVHMQNILGVAAGVVMQIKDDN